MSSIGDKSPSTGFHTPAMAAEHSDFADEDKIPPLPLSRGGDDISEKVKPPEMANLKMQPMEQFVHENPSPPEPEPEPEPEPSSSSGAGKARPSRNKKRQNPDPGEPVVLSTSITTTHTKDLHELCQTHVRLTPVFDFEQKMPQEFSVVLKLVGHGDTKEIPVEGTYPSKKHAKEAAAALGIEYVRGLPKDGASGVYADAPKEAENWVGILTGMCNGKQTRPQYTDYATPHAGFSCELRLPADLGIPGIEDMVFGDKHRSFKNKRSAKIAASKIAVLWIREQKANSATSSAAGGGAWAAPAMATGSIDVPEGTTTAQFVQMVCPRLGLASPEYIFRADTNATGMYDVDAIIKRPKGARPVKIGPIKSIYGKKKAREEISTCVLRWLKKEAEKQDITINMVQPSPPDEASVD